jgi:hypothetical protein
MYIYIPKEKTSLRTQKQWREREKQVMHRLGAKANPLSGASWLYKEDGRTGKALFQLKSTEKLSYTIKTDTLLELYKNALIEGKIPIFVVDFVNGDMLLCIRPGDLAKLVGQSVTDVL